MNSSISNNNSSIPHFDLPEDAYAITMVWTGNAVAKTFQESEGLLQKVKTEPLSSGLAWVVVGSFSEVVRCVTQTPNKFCAILGTPKQACVKIPACAFFDWLINYPQVSTSIIPTEELAQKLLHPYSESQDAPPLFLVTQEKLAQLTENHHLYISRSKEHFHFDEEFKGLLLLDVDHPSPDNLAPGQLTKIPSLAAEIDLFLTKELPLTIGAPIARIPSSSSWIWSVAKETYHIQSGGYHVYLGVACAADIPSLLNYLWLINFVNHGFLIASKAGYKLPRAFFDKVVGSPERIDYGSKVSFIGGTLSLQKKLPESEQLFITDGTPLQIFDMKARLDDIAAEVDLRMNSLSSDPVFDNFAHSRYTSHRQEQAKVYRERFPDADEETLEQYARRYNSARFYRLLPPEFVLYLSAKTPITVAEVLKNWSTYVNKGICDPLEPDYNNYHKAAQFRDTPNGNRVCISYAHGLTVSYELASGRRKIQESEDVLDFDCHIAPHPERIRFIYEPTNLTQMSDTVLLLLKKTGVYFCDPVGSTLTRILFQHQLNSYRLLLVDDVFLTKELGRLIYFPRNSIPPMLCKLVNKVTISKMDYVKGLSNLPVFTEQGTLVMKHGFNEETGVFLTCTEQSFSVPNNPTKADALSALAFIKSLLSETKFEEEQDKAAFLGAIFLSVVRGSLPVAPAVVLTATDPASGKSYCAKMLIVLCNGSLIAANSIESKTSSEELNKQIFSAFLPAPTVLYFDNINDGIPNANLLHAALTEPMISARLLGFSRNASAPTKTLVIFTGNGIVLSREFGRRCLLVRLNARVENTLELQFTKDPLKEIMQNRSLYVNAVLTCIKAFQLSKEKIDLKPHPNYEGLFEDLIRKPLIWLGELDPVKFDEFYFDKKRDDLERLMNAWGPALHELPYQMRDIVKRVNEVSVSGDSLAEFSALAFLKQELSLLFPSKEEAFNTRRLAHFLIQSKEKICGGRYFEVNIPQDEEGKSKGRPFYRLINAKREAPPVPPAPPMPAMRVYPSSDYDPDDPF